MTIQKTINQQFLDEVTVDPTYPRPSFTLPDLSGSDGNTFVFSSKIYDTLRENGFYPEANMLCGGGNYNFFMAKGPTHSALMFKTKSENHANLISLFVALENNDRDIIDEDDEYVYIKQKKNKVVKNPPLFQKLFLESSLSNTQLENLYLKNEEGFKQFNNYGRNVFHYAQSPKTLKWLIEKNEQEQFIPNLFRVDQFHQTPLHACTSMEAFTLLAKEMLKIDSSQIHSTLFQQDVFGNSCFITMSRIFEKELKQIKESNLHTLVECLATVVSIAPDVGTELISETQLEMFLKTTPYYEVAIRRNKTTTVVETVQSLIEKELMQMGLPLASSNTVKVRL